MALLSVKVGLIAIGSGDVVRASSFNSSILRLLSWNSSLAAEYSEGKYPGLRGSIVFFFALLSEVSIIILPERGAELERTLPSMV